MSNRPPQPKQRGTITRHRLEAVEKQRRAIEMRKAGATYQAIAQAVGYADHTGARKAVQRAMQDVLQEPALELKTLQIERLNHMLLTLWPKCQAGDERSINTALNVMDRLDKLMGVEAATQVDVNVNHQGAVLVIDGDREAYIRHMKRMAGVIEAQGHDVVDTEAVPDGDGVSEPKELGAGEVQQAEPGWPTSTAAEPPEADPAPPIPLVHTGGKYKFSVEPGDDDDEEK